MSDHIGALRDYDGCEIGPEIRSPDDGRILAKTGEGIYVLAPEDMQRLSRVVNLALFARVFSGAILLACFMLFVAEMLFLVEQGPEAVLPKSGLLSSWLLSSGFFATALISWILHEGGWKQFANFGFSRLYRHCERLAPEEHEDLQQVWDLAGAARREPAFAGRVRLVNIGERVVMASIMTVAVVWNLIDEYLQHSQDGLPYSIGSLYVLPCVLVAYLIFTTFHVRDELRRGKPA